MKIRALTIRALALLALLAVRPEVQACAVCFGKSNSNMAKGMNMGIFTLLIFIGGTLGALSTFFVFLAVRSSRSPQQPAAEASVTEPETDSSDKPAQS